MPLYEFICNNCEEKKDIIVKAEDRDEPIECPCGNGELCRNDRLFAAGLQFKGRWFKNAGSY